MFGPKMLDMNNTYIPNLDDIAESARLTYGEANEMFKMCELYLNDIEKRIDSKEFLLEDKIYGACHTVASVLAECCEMYLKALFLYDNKDGKFTCKELWSILGAKTKKDKTKEDGRVRDKNGNVVYYQTENDNETPLKYPDGTIVYVYAKVDSFGNLVKDVNGNQIYVDKLGNEYDDNQKGKAVKTNGHALDRLVEMISPEARLLLETRMLTIPMEKTEKNGSVSILDILQKNGLLNAKNHISQEQYVGWLDQHKKTFEQSRYSGQKKYDVSVEFMFHLATQIKAVAQYKMEPKKDQIFTITSEELLKLPDEIKKFVAAYPRLMSKQLIELIISNEDIKNKVTTLLSHQSLPPKEISQKNFYGMIKYFDIDEIDYVLRICSMAEEYLLIDFSDIYSQNKNGILSLNAIRDQKAFKIATLCNYIHLSPNDIIGFFIQIKILLKTDIKDDVAGVLFDTLVNNIYNMDYIVDYDKNNKFISRDFKSIKR